MPQFVDASLIITVLNEEASIVTFLSGVATQTTLPREIVVVDGGSTDATVECIRRWEAPAGVDVAVHVVPNAGISMGRNRAIELARYERILITDAGTEMAAGWISEISRADTDGAEADVVSGFFFPVGDTFLQRAIAFTITPRLQEIDPASFLPSSRSVSLTKSAWTAVGGYPEWLDYCEDLVFDMALREAGFTFVFRPRAQVSWSARPSLRAFMKQYYRYARGDGKAGLWRKRHIARYTAYAVGLVLLAAGFWAPLAWVALVAGFIAYVSKFFVRVVARRREFGRGAIAAAFLSPVIVVLGDIAKMAGYPEGLRWKRRRRP